MICFPFQLQTNLGNWLFQYAAALSLQDDVVGWLEDPGAAKPLRDYGDIFGALKIVRERPSGLETYAEPSFAYSPLPAKLKTGNWLLRGYLQCERHFARKEILCRFAPAPERVRRLQAKYGEWLQRPQVTGISVRRGDYLKLAQWHPFVGKRYFVDALARLSDSRDFIVCSDDIAWCKRWFPRRFPDRRFLFVEGESVLDQLYAQTLCTNNIISNSSFSWWGAWLNDHPGKRVLAPSLWFGFAYRNLDWGGIYADGWEIVPNRYTFARWSWGQLTWAWYRFKKRFYPVKRWICVNLLGGTH